MGKSNQALVAYISPAENHISGTVELVPNSTFREFVSRSRINFPKVKEIHIKMNALLHHFKSNRDRFVYTSQFCEGIFIMESIYYYGSIWCFDW